MTPEQTLDWLAQQHWEQCREDRPIQDWIRKMKSQLPPQMPLPPHECKTDAEKIAYAFGWNKCMELHRRMKGEGA